MRGRFQQVKTPYKEQGHTKKTTREKTTITRCDISFPYFIFCDMLFPENFSLRSLCLLYGRLNPELVTCLGSRTGPAAHLSFWLTSKCTVMRE